MSLVVGNSKQEYSRVLSSIMATVVRREYPDLALLETSLLLESSLSLSIRVMGGTVVETCRSALERAGFGQFADLKRGDKASARPLGRRRS